VSGLGGGVSGGLLGAAGGVIPALAQGGSITRSTARPGDLHACVDADNLATAAT
jgi:hypothetical protein